MSAGSRLRAGVDVRELSGGGGAAVRVPDEGDV